MGLIPGLERSPEVGNGRPLQYSCLENSMDRGAYWATVLGVAKSWSELRDRTQTHSYHGDTFTDSTHFQVGTFFSPINTHVKLNRKSPQSVNLNIFQL